ncbi:hypothetical protein Bca52824_095461 [Brassica carinata]|uniref:Uncharacterized protein n=1 Tax=Brassica carinata TaxID=52824 RepID=A0A8X7TI62_BRACI|nr:hypothetical protein Bca52824_095461 [Brassica carinata]
MLLFRTPLLTLSASENLASLLLLVFSVGSRGPTNAYTCVCRVVGTQKDYAIKALVNTADHLGSVTYEANEYVDEKVDQVAGTELRVACIDQW